MHFTKRPLDFDKYDHYEISQKYTAFILEYLNISETDNALDLGLALGVADVFRLEKDKAISIIEKIKTEVKKWKIYATKVGISKGEQERVSSAFHAAFQ